MSDTEQSFREWLVEQKNAANQKFEQSGGMDGGGDKYHLGRYQAYQDALHRFVDPGSAREGER